MHNIKNKSNNGTLPQEVEEWGRLEVAWAPPVSPKTTMNKRFMLVLNWLWVVKFLSHSKLRSRYWFPLGLDCGWLRPPVELLVRFRTPDGRLEADPEGKIVQHKGMYYLQSQKLVDNLPSQSALVEHVYLLVEGSEGAASIVVNFDDGSLLRELEKQDPSLRLHAYDLPPTRVTLVDTSHVLKAVLEALRGRDSELYSRRTDDFVRSPHILLALLSHVMELRSKDQIDFVSNLRCIADHLRERLKGRIVKLNRSHQQLWAEWYGHRISFVDGGVARVTGLPGSEPLAIRVGIYTVIPGESDASVREEWSLHPYVAGDIINAPADPDEESPEPPDRKRLQEAARYILEALTVLTHSRGSGAPDILFLHGPLVNSFEMYDEGEPNYIPAVDPLFLESHGITEQEIAGKVSDIPRRRDRRPMWNQCMAVYGYLMKSIFDLKIPVIGVVERSASRSFTRAVLDQLVRDRLITESIKRKLIERLDHYRITDELLFGCVLDEGEYIEPLPLKKNIVRRARDAWKPVVAQYPNPLATYLKTSASNFPYRVEFNRTTTVPGLARIMALLYHTSRLLPDYAFPVGLDIADKFAKVPDWLSSGVSAAIAAQVLAKAASTGQPRILEQVRRLLAQSPRDFFFRPRAL